MDGEVVQGDIINEPSVEKVDKHILERLDQMVLNAESPEEVLACTEAFAKYLAARRNNDTISAGETDEERAQRVRQATVADILKGDKTGV